VRRSCIGYACQTRPAELEVEVGGVAVFVGDVQEDVLAGDDGGFHALELIADRRGDLVPGRAGTHDRVDLGRTEPAGCGVVGAGRAGVGVGAGQHLSGAGEPVLGDDLMADAVTADVEEVFDAEV